MKKIKHIVSIEKGKVPKEFVFSNPNDELPIYLAMDYLRDKLKRISYVPNYEKYVNVEEDEILLLWDGSNAGEFLRSKKGVLSSTMAVIREKDKMDRQFLFYQFKNFERYLKDITVGMGIPHVNPQELLNFSFLIPSLEHQATIANYLDKKTSEIDQLINQKETLLNLYEEEKTAIINQAVTKGVPSKDKACLVSTKDSGVDWLGEIPEHWEVERMASFGKFSKGKGVSKSQLTTEGVPVILYGDIYTKYNFVTNDLVRRTSKETSENSIQIFENDLLFTASGETREDIGKCVLFNQEYEAFAGGDVIIFRQNKNNSLFLTYVFNSSFFREQKAKLSRGEIVVHIYQAQLRDIYFALPKKTEQTQIVNHIETETTKINTKVTNTKKLIVLLKEYKTALISEVVTGKIKVN